MSKQLRRVPANWEHPKDAEGIYIPLHGKSFRQATMDWDEQVSQWEKGFRHALIGDGWEPKTADMTGSFSEWDGGERPEEKETYMPDWSADERTHYQMYEHVTEGTPISPVMESPEALARWLADNKVPADPWSTKNYGQWLAIIREGPLPISFTCQSENDATF